MDGSVTDVPDSAENAEHFGRPSNQSRDGAFPQVRWVAAAESGTGRLLGAAMGPYRAAEQPLARRHVPAEDPHARILRPRPPRPGQPPEIQEGRRLPCPKARRAQRHERRAENRVPPAQPMADHLKAGHWAGGAGNNVSGVVAEQFGEGGPELDLPVGRGQAGGNRAAADQDRASAGRSPDARCRRSRGRVGPLALTSADCRLSSADWTS
jgi:hypothetical protein